MLVYQGLLSLSIRSHPLRSRHRVPLGAPGTPRRGQQRQVPVAALQQFWPLHGGPKEGSQRVFLVPGTTMHDPSGKLWLSKGHLWQTICAKVLLKLAGDE